VSEAIRYSRIALANMFVVTFVLALTILALHNYLLTAFIDDEATTEVLSPCLWLLAAINLNDAMMQT